eukprot:TRINITY_DN17810_c0_g1_i1.p1 TRINITY_DN17810_c0_g1~~TRINITY_DN17810_c0_g1_i1.p1  ORF type:complete len:431 (-),score=87.72 TRINITY_DN17810_c0_g1_i1:13-1305(-)
MQFSSQARDVVVDSGRKKRKVKRRKHPCENTGDNKESAVRDGTLNKQLFQKAIAMEGARVEAVVRNQCAQLTHSLVCQTDCDWRIRHDRELFDMSELHRKEQSHAVSLISKLSDDKKQLLSALEEKSADLERSNADADTLHSQNASLRASNKALAEENCRLREQVEEAAASSECHHVMDNLTSSVQTLLEDKTKLTEKIEEMTSAAKALEEENKNKECVVQAEIQNLKFELALRDKTVSELQRRLSELQDSPTSIPAVILTPPKEEKKAPRLLLASPTIGTSSSCLTSPEESLENSPAEMKTKPSEKENVIHGVVKVIQGRATKRKSVLSERNTDAEPKPKKRRVIKIRKKPKKKLFANATDQLQVKKSTRSPSLKRPRDSDDEDEALAGKKKLVQGSEEADDLMIRLAKSSRQSSAKFAKRRKKKTIYK